jgi:DNA (cytosine-5)-methyltransferase 1
MPKDLLVRGLSKEDTDWISSAKPVGMTQSEFLKAIIQQARSASTKLPTNKASRAKPRGSAFTFIDLFAGIGGFHLGMHSVGGQCVFSNEWDKYAARTYSEWTRSTDLSTEDIRTLDHRKDIPDHDVLLAGFPCQPFSIAGVSKKNSLGRKHGFSDLEQGNLFFAICDIANAKRPPVMILENVKNLRSHDKGNTWRVINESLDALGYTVHSAVIDAKRWVPQHRERIFLVCFSRQAFTSEEIESFSFPTPPQEGPVLNSILEQNPDPKYMITDKLWAYLQAYAEKHRAKGNGFGYQLVSGQDISRTMSARYYKDGSEILIHQPGWRNPRRLTPSEAANLMGFTSKFAGAFGHGDSLPQVVSDTQAYKQFGNSVSPLVVEAVGKQVKKVLVRRRNRLNNETKAL